MKMIFSTGSLAGLLFLAGSSFASGHIETSIDALACEVSVTPSSPQACPYPSDVEKHDVAFRQDIARFMKNAGLEAQWSAEGALRGPETPLEPVILSGVTWLKGSSCEQHNCSNHRIDYLYQPFTHGLVAIYRNGEQTKIIGNPDSQQVDELKEE